MRPDAALPNFSCVPENMLTMIWRLAPAIAARARNSSMLSGVVAMRSFLRVGIQDDAAQAISSMSVFFGSCEKGQRPFNSGSVKKRQSLATSAPRYSQM